jgi:hypothetical protein
LKHLEFPLETKYSALASSVMREKPALVLYGIASLGKALFDILVDYGFSISLILDGNPKLHGTSYKGVKIAKPETFNDRDAVTVICSNGFYDEMEAFIRARGAAKILPFYFPFLGKSVDKSNIYFFDTAIYEDAALAPHYNDDTKLYFKTIDLTITEKCTLRCKNCCNHIQYFKTPKHACFDETSASLDILFNTIDHCTKMHILGGEPFCNPELSRYLYALQKYKNLFYIEVFSNGTVFPDSDTITALKETGALVKISDYGAQGQKSGAVQELLSENGVAAWTVRYEQWPTVNKLGFFNRGGEENRRLFEKCAIHNIWTLAGGKLWRCPAASNAAKLGALPVRCNEYAQIFNNGASTAFLRKDITELRRLKFLKACDYCGTLAFQESAPLKAGEQIDAPLEYTMYG